MIAPPDFSDPGFAVMAAFVAERTGLVFGPPRYRDFEDAITRCMKTRGLTDLGQYQRLVEGTPDAHEQLMSELTVGETYFFRHRDQFDFLRDDVLPALTEAASDRPLRLWSAGCASGEEPYSLAILLDTLGGLRQADILGTDLSRSALAKARAGIYRSWSLRGDESTPAAGYLRPQDPQAPGALLELDERIRGRVRFALLNLAADVYPSPMTGVQDMDVIFCRNVLIYLQEAAVARVAEKLFQTLQPGGWLFTSPTDPPLADFQPFEVVMIPAGGIAYRRASLATSTAARTRTPIARPTRARALREGRPRRTRMPGPLGSEPQASDEIRALLAAGDRVSAVRRAQAEIEAHPLSAALQHLLALTLFEMGRLSEAELAIRRALYLDPTLALAHLASGSIARARGDGIAAKRAFGNALALTETQPPDARLPLGEGETAGRVAALARQHLAFLADARASSPAPTTDETSRGRRKVDRA